MPITLPGERRIAGPQQRAGLNYKGAPAPTTYQHANIRAPDTADRGGEALGQSLTRAGDAFYQKSERDRQRTATLEGAAAKSFFQRESLRIQGELEQDPDYENYEKNFNDRSQKAYEASMRMVKDPEARAMLDLDLKDEAARTASGLKSLRYKKSVAARSSMREEILNQSIDNALAAPDPVAQKAALQPAEEAIAASLREGLINPGEAQAATRKFREDYAGKWAGIQQPEVLIDLFRKSRTTVKTDDIIRATIDIEGGYNASDGASGAPVIYGINRKYHPEAFEQAQKITGEKGAEAGKKYAQEFYTKEYFDKHDLARFSPDVQQVLFDGVINHSVAFNKKMIAAAVGGKDAGGLIEMRRAEYLRLAQDKAYAPSLEGWMNRLDKVRGRIGTTGQTGTPLDYLPVDKKTELRNRIVKNSMDQQIEADPQASLDLLRAGQYDNILLSSEKAAFEAKARGEVLTQAAQRQTDPAAWAARKGMFDTTPLEFSSPEGLAAQIAQRMPVSAAISGKYAAPLQPMTNDEATGIAGHLDKLTAAEKLEYIKSLRDHLPFEGAFRSVVDQIAPKSPVTAWAGAYLDADRNLQLSGGLFGKSETVEPSKVAARLLAGAEALKNKDIAAPTDKDTAPLFDEEAGDAFRGFPRQAAEARGAVDAYYVAMLAENGVVSGEFDDQLYAEAVQHVLGDVVDVNGNGDILPPWGVDEASFMDAAGEAFGYEMANRGFDMNAWKFDDVGLANTGVPGLYQVYNGSAPLTDKNGVAVQLNVGEFLKPDSPLRTANRPKAPVR